MEKRYRKLLNKVVERREEVDNFVKMLHTDTNWLISPASSRYHLNKEGGLLEHSVSVTETLLKLRETLAPKITEESCIIVGLFHDVGKIGMPGKPYYIPTESGRYPYVKNSDMVAMGLACRSLYLVSKYIPLTDEEAQAIAYHDGQYVPEGRNIAHKEAPLTLLLHWADYWTAHIHEESREIKSNKEYFKKEE